MDEMKQNVLDLKNVAYRYEGSNKNVLHDINIDFEKGKLYSIMGKSGAGKSTLLSLISGLDTPTSGSIEYKSINIKKIDRDKYRAGSIGVIFQGYNLLTNATALENIVLSMDISGNKVKGKKERAYEILKKVGISREKTGRRILNLSGGEQQRVGIARAIVNDPEIIIADEPTGNLDSDTEKNIMDILSALAREENKCVIIATHSKSLSKYADELWGLNQGNLVFVK